MHLGLLHVIVRPLQAARKLAAEPRGDDGLHEEEHVSAVLGVTQSAPQLRVPQSLRNNQQCHATQHQLTCTANEVSHSWLPL